MHWRPIWVLPLLLVFCLLAAGDATASPMPASVEASPLHQGGDEFGLRPAARQAAGAPQVETPDPAWLRWEALPSAVRNKVDPRILAELRGEVLPTHLGGGVGDQMAAPPPVPLDKTRFLVNLYSHSGLDQVSQQVFASQADRRSAVVGSLAATARAEQAAVRSFLDARVAQDQVDGYQPFFIVNALAVDGDLATLIDLALRPDVEKIVANYALVPLFAQRQASVAPAAGAPSIGAAPQVLSPENWNIDLVDADRVWSELGIRGEGAVVAGFDTGVGLSHPALADAYRGRQPDGSVRHDYSWFEPDSKLYPDGNLGPSRSSTPYDCDYWSTHGTHTMGTMVGAGQSDGQQVGMAPGARWIAVPGICGGTMPGGIGDDIGGLKAFQWLLCPTDLTGDLDSADCTKAPDVVNNSWGSANPTADVFRPAIQALRAAGVAPVFAAGNPTAGAGSIGSPANAPEAITVGATDSADELATFSGRGPSFFAGEQKPELTAPGVNVKSSVASRSYEWGSGTSMAAPHVAGLMALMVSADLRDGRRDFAVDELERFMQFTAIDLGNPGPDDAFGYGRIDALAAVRWVLTAGDLAGAVVAAGTGTPIAGAIVTGTGGSGHDFQATTAANGVYSVTVPGGSYDVTVSAWGYNAATFTAQQVFASTRSIADFALAPLPTASLQGRVQAGGSPVGDAQIHIAENPAVRTQSIGDGSYTLELPLGEHTLVVQRNGYRAVRSLITVTAGANAHDLALTAAPTVLLVDADAHYGWFDGWPAMSIFREALDARGYVHDLWRIEYTDFQDTKTLADGATGFGLPSAATLGRYRAVIWVHTGCGLWCSAGGSPEDIGADDILADYLDGGGRLILSGQDVAYWDDGESFLDDYLHADLTSDIAAIEGDAIVGSDFLDAVRLALSNATLRGYPNGGSALWPDAVEPIDGAAYPVMQYDNQAGKTAALAIAPCDASYRAVYLAMGLENVGPRAAESGAALAEALDRSLAWVVMDRPATGVSLSLLKGQQSGAPGTRLLYDLLVTNRGQQAGTIRPAVAASVWPTRLFSGTAELDTGLWLAPCGNAHLTLEVTVPSDATLGSRNQAAVTAAFDGSADRSTVHATSLALEPWHVLHSELTSRYRLGAAALDDRYLYVVGGWNNDLNSIFSLEPAADDNERYDVCTGAWQRRASLPTSVANAAMAALDGKLYVVGGAKPYGFFDFQYSKDVYVYDPEANSWQSVAALPMALSGAAAAAFDGKLYVFGGANGSSLSSQTLEYDPQRNAWQVRRPMWGGGRTFAAAATLNGKIYVAGGWPSLDTVEMYDPVTDSWSAAAPLLRGRHSFGLTATPDGKLIASGGGNRWQGLERVERFDPQNNAWESIASLKDANRAGSASAYAAGLVFHVGGSAVYRDLEALSVASGFCQSALATAVDSAAPGERITVTVTLEPDRTRVVQATLRSGLPDSVRFDGFIAAAGAVFVPERNAVEWSGQLAANGSDIVVQYAAVPIPQEWPTGGELALTAQFESADGRSFSRTSETAIVLPQFTSSVKQVDRAVAIRGDELAYHVRLESDSVAGGPASVHDALPPGLDYVPDSLAFEFGSGGYDPASRTIHWQGEVPRGANVQVNGSPDYAWGDSDGNGQIQGVTFDWVDIRSTGSFLARGSSYLCDVPIGFDFEFFGLEHTALCVSTTGFASFDGNGYSTTYNQCPLSIRGTGAIIAGIWDSLVVEGGIYFESFGRPPNRFVVFQWVDAARSNGLSVIERPDVQFQIILHENGTVKVQVLDAGAGAGSSSSTGLVGYSAGQGATYACNREDSLHDKLAVVFVPPGGSVRRANTTLRYRATVADTAPVNAAITNTVVIQGEGAPITRTATVGVNPVHLDRSSVAVEPTMASVGQLIRYRYQLLNTGLLTVTDVVLEDSLPAELAFENGSLTCGSGTCSYDQGVVTWRGVLAPAAPVHVEFAVRLARPLDDGYGNVQRLAAVFTAQRPELSSSNFAVRPSMAEPGTGVLFVFYVYNSGGGAGQGKLDITLPDGLTYDASSVACGSGVCNWANGGLAWQGIVEPHSIVQVRVHAVLPVDAAYGTRYVAEAVLVDQANQTEHRLQAVLTAAHSIYAPLVTGESGPGRTIYLPLLVAPGDD